MKQVVITIVVSLAIVVIIAYWIESKNEAPALLLEESEMLEGPLTPEELKINQPVITNDMNSVAVLTTNRGVIRLELFEDQMPITTGNFIRLAEEGFYDGTKFHRIIDNFMIQGGDPNSKTDNVASYGTGGPEYTIQDEFVAGELLTNKRGTIAMANTGQPNSGGSQFFINTVDNLSLDFDKQPLTSKHPVFGRVIEGMDIVDTIANVETGAGDVPTEPVVIESVTIEQPE
jgi:peptidylprolyl isomerase